MKTNSKTFLLAIFAGVMMTPTLHAAQKCSIANLTRCLDSACAINISSNPAARCQYCGTASAGEPTSGGMRSVSAGASAKYSISAKELKKAPTDPGERYAWATTQCLTKVAGCTPDDVTEKYDPLIEQSCKAAGISAQMSTLATKANKKASRSDCMTDIRSCLVDANRCGPNYAACEDNATFDKFFAQCGVEATGCDDYTSEIRTELLAARTTAVESADELLASIATGYQQKREKKLKSARDACEDGSAKEACIARVCENTMPGKCGIGADSATLEENKSATTTTYASEKALAAVMCKFHDLACDTLN